MGPTIQSGTVTGIVLPNGDVDFSSPDSPKTFRIKAKELETVISFLLEARGLDLEPHPEASTVDKLQEAYLICIKNDMHYVARIAQEAIVKIKNLQRPNQDATGELAEIQEDVSILDFMMNGKAAAETPQPIRTIFDQLASHITMAKAFLGFGNMSRWLHKARGTKYRLWTEKARLQIGPELVPPVYAEKLEAMNFCVYIAEDPNTAFSVCIRAYDEFHSGRFEQIK